MQPSQYRAAPAPIQLNDTARCDGLKSPIHPGRPLGICQDCTRRPTGTLPGSVCWMEPAAKHDGTEWRCSERRSDGVHESDCAAADTAAQSCAVGGGVSSISTSGASA